MPSEIPKTRTVSKEQEALAFLFQTVYVGKVPFFTAYGVKDTIPATIYEKDKAVYALDRLLLRQIRTFIQRPAITSATINLLLEQALALNRALLLERERIRQLRQQIAIFAFRKRRYLNAWRVLVKEQQEKLDKHLQALKTADAYLKSEIIPLNISPFTTQSKEYLQTRFNVPLSLAAYFSPHRTWWQQLFSVADRLDFILARQPLLLPLQLNLMHPGTERQQLEARQHALAEDIAATKSAIDKTRYFAWFERRFLRLWLAHLQLAQHTLKQGRNEWEERLQMQQLLALETQKQEIEGQVVVLINLAPEQANYYNIAQITAAQEQLHQLSLYIQQKQQALIELTQQGRAVDYDNYLAHEGFLQKLAADIKARQQGFADNLLLITLRAAIGDCPLLTLEDSTLILNNFAAHHYWRDLKAFAAKVSLAQAQLVPDDTVEAPSFLTKTGLASWQQTLKSFTAQVIQQKLRLLYHLKPLSHIEALTPDIVEALLTLISDILASPVEHMDNEARLAVQALQQSLQKVLEEKPDTTDWQALDIETAEKEVELAQTILQGLSEGTQYVESETLDWLCQLYQKSEQQHEVRQLCMGEIQQALAEKLQKHLAAVMSIAERICENSLSQGRTALTPEALAHLLCYGRILSLGASDYRECQDKRIQAYLKAQLTLCAETEDLSPQDSTWLETLENILQHLGNNDIQAKAAKLTVYRTSTDWSGYRNHCQQWLALLTSPPVTVVVSQGLFSSAVNEPPVNDNNAAMLIEVVVS